MEKRVSRSLLLLMMDVKNAAAVGAHFWIFG